MGAEDRATSGFGPMAIEELAEANCTSVAQLERYRAAGLLKPHRDGGYDIAQSRVIDMAEKLESVGVDLDEIARIYTGADMGALADALARREAELERCLRQTLRSLEFVRTLRAEHDPALGRLVLNQIILEYLPAKRIAVFDNPAEYATFGAGEGDPSRWEWAVRCVKRRILEEGLPRELFHNVGYIMAKEDLSLPHPLLVRTFVQVGDWFNDDCGRLMQMPEGHYLTMYVSHAFPGDSAATGPSALQALLEHARNRGFEIAGDYYEESVCRWPQVFDERGEILVHCCLPVRQGER